MVPYRYCTASELHYKFITTRVEGTRNGWMTSKVTRATEGKTVLTRTYCVDEVFVFQESNAHRTNIELIFSCSVIAPEV